MANPITGSKYDEAATDAILKRRYGENLPTGFDVQDPGPRYSYPALAIKATSSVPSAVVAPSGFDSQMAAYRARQSAQPYKYGANAEVLPLNPNAPKDKVTGIMVRGVDQQGTGNAQDPIAMRAWKRQTEDRAADQQFLGGDQNSGYVSKAFSNVSGAPNIDVRRQGVAVANTNDVVNAIEQAQKTSPYLRGSAPTTFSDYERRLASMKGDTTRAIAFKPGERRPVGTREAQAYDAKKAAERATSEAALNRATQEKLSENAMKGEIGKREAAAAGEVAGINAKGEWDVAAAKAKADAMAPEQRAKMIKSYTGALANLEPDDPMAKSLKLELDALMGVPAVGGAATAAIKEGQTATDPKSGKKMKFTGGKWIPA